MEGGQRLTVGRVGIGNPTLVAQPGVFRAYGRIVEAGADGMRFHDLSVAGLQHEGSSPVQHPRSSALPVGETGCVATAGDPFASRFDAGHLYPVVQEVVEQANGVRSSSHAGDEQVGQTAFDLQDLLPRFSPDDALEVAHDGGVRVRAQRRAEQVMSGLHVGHPVTDGLIDRVLQGAASTIYRMNFGAQQLHSEDVGLLSVHVHRSHVDDAFQSQQGAGGG